MPSGRTHDRITLITLPIVSVISQLVTNRADLTLWLSGGFLFSGMMFGPDLDIHSVQFKRWGFLGWLWIPYQRLIPHRSLLSHGAIVGTLGRVVYLLVWISIFSGLYLLIYQLITKDLTYYQRVLADLYPLLRKNTAQAIALIIGCELGAMSHYISDGIGSQIKKVKRSKKRQPKKRSKK